MNSDTELDLFAYAPKAAPSGMTLDRVMESLGSPLRLAMLKIIARGQPVSVSEIARELGRKPNFIGKQLQWLREAGLIDPIQDEKIDGRMSAYMLVPPLRGQAAPMKELDLGVCVLRWPS